MRKVTSREAVRRRVAKAWLGSVASHLSDTEIAVPMLTEQRRGEEMAKNGKTAVTQAAPRKMVKAYREGSKAPAPRTAFSLGEALRSLKVAEASGFYALYIFGYAADLADALDALSRIAGARFNLVALTMFCAFAVFRQRAPLEEHADPVVNVCQDLLRRCDDMAGGLYRKAWDDHEKVSTSVERKFLRYYEDSLGQDAPFEISEWLTSAWRILLDWALSMATSAGIDDKLAPGVLEAALLSISADRTWGTDAVNAQRALLRALSDGLNEMAGPPRERAVLLPQGVVVCEPTNMCSNAKERIEPALKLLRKKDK